MSANLEPLVPGSSLLQYRLVSRLGGSVWKVEETTTGRSFALKVLGRHLPTDPAKRDIVLSEARQSAAVSHYVLPYIHELNVDKDALFMVMELLEGSPAVIAYSQTSVDRRLFLEFAYQLADGLGYLHAKGVIHRNVGAETVFLEDTGGVRLLGLGLNNLILRKESSAFSLPQDPQKAAYLSPEQIAGRPVDPRTDLFSAGVLFYQLMTRKLPFQGTSSDEIAQKILRDQPQSPLQLNPDADRQAIGIVGKCIYKDPSKRYASARAMMEDILKLEPAVIQVVKTAPTPPPIPTAPPEAPAPSMFSEAPSYEEPSQFEAAPSHEARSQFESVPADEPAPSLEAPSGSDWDAGAAAGTPAHEERRSDFIDLDLEPVQLPEPEPEPVVAPAPAPTPPPMVVPPSFTVDSPPVVSREEVRAAPKAAPAQAAGFQEVAAEPPHQAAPFTDRAVLVADLPGFDAMERADSGRASRIASRLQQIIGEAIYLYDGSVPDPFGPKVFGEVPDASAAVQALRKAQADLSEFNAGHPAAEKVEARMAIDMASRSDSPGWRALEALAQLAVGGVAASRTVLSGAMVPMEGNPLFTVRNESFGVPRPEKPRMPTLAPTETAVVAGSKAEVGDATDEAKPAAKKKKMSVGVMAGIGAAALVVIVAIVFFVVRGRGEKEAAPVVHAPVVRKEPVISIDPFLTDPTTAQSGDRIRLAATELLKNVKGLKLSTGEPPDHHFSATLSAGPTGAAQIVPSIDGKLAAPSPVDSVEAVTASYVTWVLSQTGMSGEKPAFPTEAAFNPFADALVAWDQAGRHATPQVVSAIRASLAADSNFLPSLRFAVDVYDASGDRKAGLDAGKRLLELDPAAIDVARRMMRWELEAGDSFDAIDASRAILAKDPSDAEALDVVGLYALSAGHQKKFQDALAAIPSGAGNQTRLSEPDWMLYQGRIDGAATRYYDVEANQPQNPHVALKIGRIAVLRHSGEMAKLELGKLQRLDPNYGYHILEAYTFADQRNARSAADELKLAAAAAAPEDQLYTASAEVHAILNQSADVIASLDKAILRGEASSTYVVNDPLFEYLKSDTRFQQILSREQAQIDAMRTRLEKPL